MVDHLSEERRSWNMSRIKGKNTKPEIIVRSLLHRMGYRFTVNGPLNRNLPGRPDIVLPKYKMVVFVHGCFWHRHKGCKRTTTPSTRRQFWLKKFNDNIARDKRDRNRLSKYGWRSVVVWECEVLQNPDKVLRKVDEALKAGKAK